MYNKSQENHIEQKDKSFFGVYLNQARLNAYITLCHISELLGEKTVDEDSLSEMPVLRYLGFNEKDIVKSKRTFELIENHFPMLKNIYDWWGKDEQKANLTDRSQKYKKILTHLLKSLNCKRNEYCHASSKNAGLDSDAIEELCQYLDKCFDTSVNRIKDIRSLEEKDVFHLRRKTSEGEGKNKRVIDNPNFHYHFRDEEGQLGEKGLAFLATIFLGRGDAHLLLKQLRGFKQGETPAQQATLECFCVSRIKLPKPVMKSDEDKNGIALDMLNELKKCPKELFELLSKEKQQEFRVTDTSDDNEEDNEVLMRRYSDRFPYLALRYCDENEVFKTLRFHIDLGRYYFKFYEKETIDGNKKQRALDKRLKTFGRIKNVKDKVQQEWRDIIKPPGDIDDEQSEPYKADSTPHYNLVDNQIGLVISEDRPLPDVKQPDVKIKLEKPDAWLSIYELPGMIFHGLKCGFDKTERLINIYIEKQRSICKKICDTGSIPENAGEFLPEALKDIEADNDKQMTYAAAKLKRMLEDTKHRIKAIQTTKQRAADKSSKPGKKKFFDIRAGKLADFLARDIMVLQRFDPAKKGKDKLTSINYQILQATLAFFGAKKDIIGNMFREIGLLDGDNPHPFLNQLAPARYNSIADFYIAYLDSKMQYLKNCEKDGDLDSYQFLRPSRQHYAGKRELKTIAKQLLDNPVNIPKGFFQEAIGTVVCNEEPSLKGSRMNTAYMIQANFEKTFGKQQPFYGYEKTYPVVVKAKEYSKKGANRKIIKTLKSISPEISYKEMKTLIEKEISREAKFEPESLRQNLLKGCKDFKNNERLLRRYKVQDMVTFMMVEKTLKDHLSIEGNPLRLEAVIPKEKSIFKKPIPCSTDISVSFNAGVKHETGYVNYIRKKYDGSYICQGKKIILKYRVTSENAKLKDIGKYRRYFYDRRLPGLLIWKYRPNTEGGVKIRYADIEEEIKAYEKHRKETTQQMYMLEKGVIDRFNLEIEEGANYIPFNCIIDTIKAKITGCEDKCNTLLNIRNAVYHNQFPVYDDAIQNTQGEKIAEKMKTVTENYVTEIMKGFDNV